jgi:16S rRNA (guanine527-N7)-methyltransferase
MLSVPKEKVREFLHKEYNVSHETFQKLEEFVLLLQKWNKVHNLVSEGEQNNLWERHVLDSAQLLRFVSHDKKILDIGSGAGFPGIILGILTDANVILVEKNKKKAVFLSEAKRILCPQLIIKNVSVEETNFDKVDTITARGVARVSQLLNYSSLYLKQKCKILLLKGKEWDNELEEAKINWNFNCRVESSVTNKEGKILILSEIKTKNG